MTFSFWRGDMVRVRLRNMAVMAVTFGTCFSAATAVHAWGAGGHEEVADIAYSKLTPAVKLKLAKILAAGDDLFQPQGASDDDERRAFLHASIFPDDIKQDHDSVYESIIDKENAVFPLAPGTSEGESTRCKTWHYYDDPIRYGSAPRPAINTSNAFVALTRAEDQLTKLVAANADPKMQAWYLAWIEHVIGDLHQPLHCTSDFESIPTGDAGGNLYLLADTAEGRRSELHALWDGGIDHAAGKRLNINALAPVTAAWEADPTIQPSEKEVANLDIMSWITIGADLADKNCYTGIAPGAAPSAAYLANEDLVCKKQALLGGYRLAAVLNRILGG